MNAVQSTGLKGQGMWHTRISVTVFVALCLLVACFVAPYIQKTRQAERKRVSKYNLQQMGIGLHNYASIFDGLPPGGVFNEKGRGLHGWMIATLPYIDSSLYFSFVDFNKPWDVEPNAGLFLNQIRYYNNSGEDTPDPLVKFPLAHYAANAYLMAPNSFVHLESIEAKTQTMLVGELGGQFVPWACPYNWLELDQINGIPMSFGTSASEQGQFLFADGCVRFVSDKISPEILVRMKGEDLAGFKTSSTSIHRPVEFPCPKDALRVEFRYDNDRRELVVTRMGSDGTVKSEERHPR